MILVLTEWNEFRALDLKHLREVMLGNVPVDLRKCVPRSVSRFAYHGIGRRPLP